MSHLQHLTKNKQNLQLRFEVIKLLREFFWSQGFTEVDTPNIVRHPGQEPYLSPMKINIHDETGKEFAGYLHTSPEYTMKKMLAAGWDKIFSVCKCYRDYESFGGTHEPEFLMIEWYRAGEDFFALMNDVESAFNFLIQRLSQNFQFSIFNFQSISNFQFKKFSMRELWKRFVSVDLDEYLTSKKMFGLCVKKGYNVKEDESYEDLFYRIFLNEIEPKLKDMGGVIVHHYPAQMAALSRLSPTDPRYAERFEVYINGLELANAFSELTDADEQLKRLKEEQALRQKLGKDVYDIDTEFISALKTMPPSAGIALGIDRLVMVLGGCEKIENVITLPPYGRYY
ncbi:MAG: EF-P lysine aminoacylase EpmA [Patescibacteria group bacterium]